MRNLLLTNILNKQKPKMDSGGAPLSLFIIYNNKEQVLLLSKLRVARKS